MSNARNLANLLGTGTQITTADIADGAFQANKNLIINGSMQLDQRGNASATNLTGGGVFTTDRFFGQTVGAGLTVSAEQSTTVPSGTNFQYSTKHTVTAAASGTDHWTRLTTRLEGYDIAGAGLNTSGNKLTLSFYVQSTRTGTHTIGLSTGYRAGASYDQAAITLTYTINSANTWERKTIAFDSYDTGGSAAWNTDNNLGVEIVFTAGQGATAHGSGSINSAFNTWEDFSSTTFVHPKSTSDNNNWGTSTSDRWYITGIQLEVGETATPFEHRSFGDELARCQRYFEKSYSDSTAPGTITITGVIRFRAASSSVEFPLSFLVKKRAAPTVTLYSYATGASGNIRDVSAGSDGAAAVASIGEIWCFATKNTGGSDGNQYAIHFTADAEL